MTTKDIADSLQDNGCLWIIIPAHNRRELTRKCLECLYNQSYKNFKIIIIDDGSSDGTAEMINGEFPDVILLKGDGNLFWAKAINLGIEEALKKTGGKDYILTLNNDVVFQEIYLQSLMEFAAKYPRTLIGSVAISSVDKKTIVDGGVQVNWLTAKFKTLMAGKSYPEVSGDSCLTKRVDVLSGRGTLIPVEVFKKIGLYNARQLPHYGADYEFSVRAKRNGYQLLVDYQAVVISHVKETGLNNTVKSLSWKDYLRSFGSIRSPNNLYYRWHFSQLCCSGVKGFLFYAFDVIRVVFGSFRNQIVRTWR